MPLTLEDRGLEPKPRKRLLFSTTQNELSIDECEVEPSRRMKLGESVANERESVQLQEILAQYQTKIDPKQPLKGEPMRLELTSDEPVYIAPRYKPPEKQKACEEYIEQALKDDIIEKIPENGSAYSSPVSSV